MPKGGAKIGEHVLFGKYRLCRKLGAGRSGNVFLAWQGQETLPEADFFVLVCGGKWWETARTLAASRYFLSRGRCILLFNHMSEDLRMKLPDDLKGVPCFYLPFFANPLKEDRDAAACFREIMTTGTGGMKTWERKKRRRGFWTRRPGS